MDAETFVCDRHAQGWRVYRFTWRQLQDDPASVIGVLARALEQ